MISQKVYLMSVLCYMTFLKLITVFFQRRATNNKFKNLSGFNILSVFF